jgi:excisionase family DNA binding protein
MPPLSKKVHNGCKGLCCGIQLAPSDQSAEVAQQIHPLLYSASDAARRLGVSESTVWRLLGEEEIYPTYVRRRTMISEAELQRYVAESTMRPREQETPIADKTQTEMTENLVGESTIDDTATNDSKYTFDKR